MGKQPYKIKKTKVKTKMAFMKKDVNLGLILLIIATLLLFTGFTVFYQKNFKEVTTEYNDKLAQLNKVKQELENEKNRLNQTYELRVKAEKDVQALDSQYKQLSEERDQLESDKNTLQSELSSTKIQLASSKAELSQTQELLASVQTELSLSNSRLSSCNRKLDSICDKYPDESEC